MQIYVCDKYKKGINFKRLPKEMYEEVEGIFTYTGNLSKSELEILLDNIFS